MPPHGDQGQAGGDVDSIASIVSSSSSSVVDAGPKIPRDPHATPPQRGPAAPSSAEQPQQEQQQQQQQPQQQQQQDQQENAEETPQTSSGSSLLCCFKQKRVDKERSFPLSDPHQPHFKSNEIISSKYVLYNPFHPRFVIWKNLFEQFQKSANIYFLVMSALMQIPGISPFGRWTTAATLAFVCIISLLKALWEDIQRHRDDREKNGKIVRALRGSQWVDTAWIDIKVGDFVLLEQPQVREDGSREGVPVPCDLLIVATSAGTDGKAYVETMDLDGETNLKPKGTMSLVNVPSAPDGGESDKATSHFMSAEACASELVPHASIRCDTPNADLSQWWGSVTFSDPRVGDSRKATTVSQTNMLFRGARMCKAPALVGIAIYTGHETKLGKNMSDPPSKVSRMERLTNRRLLLIVVLQIFLCIVSAVGFAEWSKDNKGAYYADYPTGDAGAAAMSFFTFFILYSNLIPISLYVSMEITKFAQGYFMARDHTMYDSSKDLPANIRTTDINDEIGQVSHVFSDKTGTLTQNKMEILKFICDGTTFGKGSTAIAQAAAKRSGNGEKADERPLQVIKSPHWPFWDPRIQSYMENGKTVPVTLCWNSSSEAAPSGLATSTRAELRRFFETLALCSTVLPSKRGAMPNKMHRGVMVGRLDADSPDEHALVKAAGEFGISLIEGSEDAQTIEINSQVLSPGEKGSGGASGHLRKRFRTLARIDFNSDRKRMSIVVCDDVTHEMHLLMKGADSLMEPRLSSGTSAPRGLQGGLRDLWKRENAWRDYAYYSAWLAAGRGAEGVAAIQAALPSGGPAGAAEMLSRLYQNRWLMEEADGPNVTDACGQLAEDGLRTLYIARRAVSAEEWALWEPQWLDVQRQALKPDQKQAKIDELAAQLEHSVDLVGVTAIEDKLQDEVPETIEALRDAGIRVWMITGDKRSTAVNIGHACALLDETLDKHNAVQPIILDGEGTNDNILANLDTALVDARARRENEEPYALVLTSHAIKHIFAHPKEAGGAEKRKHAGRDEGGSNVDKLYEIAVEAKSVIVARATPMQKAQMVDMIKSRDPWNVTLAIGDGANDVAMIQKAHVGVGIKGVEGGQAAAQADFGIGQFRFLHPLLFKHGRWNYRRLALFSTYFFYKNAVMSFSLFFYNMLNGFSGQPLYDPWVIACFNVMWASWPIIIVSIFDRDVVDTDYLKYFPVLYKMGRHNSDYTPQRMIQWYVTAILHAVICVFFPLINMFANPVDSDGRDYGLYHGGVLVYTNVVVVITLKLALHVTSWTWVHHLFIWVCLLSWPAFLPLYSALSPSFFGIYTMSREFENSVGWSMFWVMLLGTVVVCLMRDFTWRYMSYRVFPLPSLPDAQSIVLRRQHEPGWRYTCAPRPMSFFKIVQLVTAVDSRRPHQGGSRDADEEEQ